MVSSPPADQAAFPQVRYWLAWLLVTAAGWLIGHLANLWLAAALNLNATGAAAPDETTLALGGLIVLVGVGLPIGVAQWLVLRRQLPGAAWWIGLTTLGFTLGTWTSIALMGLGVGIAQWWLLNKYYYKAGWWPTTSALIWPVGYMAGGWIGQQLAAGGLPDLWVGLIGRGVTGLVIGAVSGAVWLWLMREERLAQAGEEPTAS